MDRDEARDLLRNHVRWDGAVDDAITTVLAHLDTIDHRARQVRDGFLNGGVVWSPREVVDFLMAEAE